MATTQDVALPSWIRVGAKCRWWSESQKTLHPIVITSLDTLKRRVVVHFEADHRVWKTVPFAHLGSSGPLRPLTADTPEPVAEKPKGAIPAPAASAEQNGRKEKEEDGTSTPPWYEQIMVAENREYVKDEQRRKEEEMIAQQERKRTALQQEMQKQAEQDKRAREQEKRRREETAEAERLRILEKLIKEREDEHCRLEEVHKMEHEELVSGTVNVVWRQREQVERRQREEEERAEREEEERRKEEKLQEELAARPRVSFGVAVKMYPQKILIPQDGLKASSQDLTDVLPTNSSSTKRWDQSQAGSMSWPRTAPVEETHDTEGMPAEVEQGASQPLLEMEEMEVPMSASEYYGGLICSIYERHNPTKVHDVPALLEKYSGCELEMYHRICEKYGVDPEPTPSHLARTSPPRSPAPEPVGYARKASAPPPPRHSGLKRPSPTAPPQPPSPQQAPTASSLLARFQSLVGTEEEDAMSDPGASNQADATAHATWGHRGHGVAPGDANSSHRSRVAYVPGSWERGQSHPEHSRNLQNGGPRPSTSSTSRYRPHPEEGIDYRDGGRDQHMYRDQSRDDRGYRGRSSSRWEADRDMDHGPSADSWGARHDYDSGYRERSRSAARRHRGFQGGNYRCRHDSRHPHRGHYRSVY